MVESVAECEVGEGLGKSVRGLIEFGGEGEVGEEGRYRLRPLHDGAVRGNRQHFFSSGDSKSKVFCDDG